MGFSRQEYGNDLPLPSPGDRGLSGISQQGDGLWAQCSWTACLVPCLSQCCSLLSVSAFIGHHVSVSMWPEVETKALLKWLGRESGKAGADVGWCPKIKLPTYGDHTKSKGSRAFSPPPTKKYTSLSLTRLSLWLCASQQTVEGS